MNKKQIFTIEQMAQHDYSQPLITFLAKLLGRMVGAKNASYNDSYNRTDELLHLLFPEGISSDQYHLIPPVVRWFDKTNRLISNPNAYGESPRFDQVGYSLLDLVKDIKEFGPRIVLDAAATQELDELYEKYIQEGTDLNGC